MYRTFTHFFALASLVGLGGFSAPAEARPPFERYTERVLRPERTSWEKVRPEVNDSIREKHFTPPIRSEIANKLMAAGAGENFSLTPEHVKKEAKPEVKATGEGAANLFGFRDRVPVKAKISLDKERSGINGAVEVKVGLTKVGPAENRFAPLHPAAVKVKTEIMLKMQNANRSVEPKPGLSTTEQRSGGSRPALATVNKQHDANNELQLKDQAAPHMRQNY